MKFSQNIIKLMFVALNKNLNPLTFILLVQIDGGKMSRNKPLAKPLEWLKLMNKTEGRIPIWAMQKPNVKLRYRPKQDIWRKK